MPLFQVSSESSSRRKASPASPELCVDPYLLRLLSTDCAPLDLIDNHVRGSNSFPLQSEAVPGELGDLQCPRRGDLHWGMQKEKQLKLKSEPRWGADGQGAKHQQGRCLRPACLSLLQTRMTMAIRTDRGKLFLRP